ncbi:MAG: SigB/SigF/SigG family RNA polymerase sigma factor [Acidimicrobiia bacterium]
MTADDSCERAESAEPSELLGEFREYRRTHDRTLRNRLIEHHVHLAQSLARRFANRSEPLDDLEQVAMLGLLKAVERFDPDRGTPFAAFAVPTVIGELRRHFRDQGWMVRVPRRVQDLHLRIGTVISELSQQLGQSPTPREIAEAAGVRDEDVLEALDAGNRYRPTSLDFTPNGAAGETLRGDADTEFASVEDRATLLNLLHRLPEREQRVMYMRYFEDMTQAEIAETIGVSQMHVSRLLSRSLDALARDQSADS